MQSEEIPIDQLMNSNTKVFTRLSLVISPLAMMRREREREKREPLEELDFKNAKINKSKMVVYVGGFSLVKP